MAYLYTFGLHRLLFPETEAVVTDGMRIYHCGFMQVKSSPLKYPNTFMDVLLFLHFINVRKICTLGIGL